MIDGFDVLIEAKTEMTDAKVGIEQQQQVAKSVPPEPSQSTNGHGKKALVIK